jgi:hypothetical protein
MADGDLDSSENIVQRNTSEEPITEAVTATATFKNQKTSHWFMCYKSVKGIIVAQSSESSDILKCQTSIDELLSRCVANM